MIRWVTFLLELVIAGAVIAVWRRLKWRKYKRSTQYAFLVLCVCAVFASFSIAASIPRPQRTLTVTATGEKNEKAENSQIYFKDIKLNGESIGLPKLESGEWTWYKKSYCWFEAGDNRIEGANSDSITLKIDAVEKTELVFTGNKWKGIVEAGIDGKTVRIDTYMEGETGVKVTAELPGLSFAVFAKIVAMTLAVFTVAYLLMSVAATAIVLSGSKLVAFGLEIFQDTKIVQKALRYQFLFEELVKRDFKKKYKRTVLGMGWSLLSPLLLLLVMKIIFTQFFGRDTPHYTIYLFCGNLIFSYFSESTKSGMKSLMENSKVFSKVTVPKYLFLLSKNVQTFISFLLTLVIFFIFVAFDNLSFTWKFVCLLYPICCLILFNIGMGLILSAMYVFFRDIQYLYDVFVKLLSYLSAIFYTIDRYSPQARNLFLLNPIYLFIRYFRKIVIEATIPAPQFHLLMLADVVIALGLGSVMYKKYNTKFLYYV